MVYSEPSIEKNEFKKTENTSVELNLITEKDRIIFRSSKNGCNSVKVVPFLTNEQEEIMVLEQEQEKGFLFIMFGTIISKFVTYEDKKITISKEIIFEKKFIFDEEEFCYPNEKRLILHASKLSSKIDINSEGWWSGFRKKVEENPDKMVLLCNKTEVIWLDDYVLVSELRKLKIGL